MAKEWPWNTKERREEKLFIAIKISTVNEQWKGGHWKPIDSYQRIMTIGEKNKNCSPNKGQGV